MHNLLTVAIEVGEWVKCPTPYEISEVYLESEFQSMQEWINELKIKWKDIGVIIMWDDWTNSINHRHISNC